ncbi:MAG: conserved membrane protein of unknown function [Candidatus Thorarchaeota archaeon]|nr:MAG: conserved membrane protein of unknown function [Candidatus Thorarchaeota archaeon]
METQETNQRISRSRWVSLTSIMTALALVGNYVLVGIPNVEFGTTILFVTGYLFGFHMAAWSTLIMSIIYGSINPWGAFIPPIWITQVVGWLFISASGSILGEKERFTTKNKERMIELGLTGAFLTLFFDLITNAGYAYAFSIPYYITILSGIVFMVVHVVSNSIIFASAVPILEDTIRQHMTDLIWFDSKDLPEHSSEESKAG